MADHRQGTYRVVDKYGTGTMKTLRVELVAPLTWRVTHRGEELATLEQSKSGWDAELYEVIHYRVTFKDGTVADSRELGRKAVGWDTQSVLERLWHHVTGYRPLDLTSSS